MPSSTIRSCRDDSTCRQRENSDRINTALLALLCQFGVAVLFVSLLLFLTRLLPNSPNWRDNDLVDWIHFSTEEIVAEQRLCASVKIG